MEPWHEELVGLSALETMAFLIGACLEILGSNGAPVPAASGVDGQSRMT
jgi:hypothetical protein